MLKNKPNQHNSQQTPVRWDMWELHEVQHPLRGSEPTATWCGHCCSRNHVAELTKSSCHTRRGPPPAPRPPGSRHSELPAAGPGTCWDGVRERVCELTSLPLHHQAYTRCSGLARRCAPALPCLAVFLGAGELPRRLVFSCVCAGMVPVAPAVGAVLVCACGPGGRRCGLMCVWYLR